MANLAGLRVLVAEDDFLIATHLEDFLSENGASVEMVSQVSELLKVDPKAYDVAILDHTLTDGEVDGAADRLVDAGVPVIFQSGRDAEIRKRWHSVTVLPKPVREDVLLDTLAVHRR